MCTTSTSLQRVNNSEEDKTVVNEGTHHVIVIHAEAPPVVDVDTLKSLGLRHRFIPEHDLREESHPAPECICHGQPYVLIRPHGDPPGARLHQELHVDRDLERGDAILRSFQSDVHFLHPIIDVLLLTIGGGSHFDG